MMNALRLMIGRLGMLMLFLGAVLLSGCAIQSVTEPHSFDPALEPTPVPTAVLVAKPTYLVELGTVTASLSLTGRVVPETETAVSFPREGLVTAVLVEAGAKVAANDLLAELDSSDILAERQLAETALTLLEAQLVAMEMQQATARRRAEIAFQQAQIQLDYVVAQGGDTPTAEAQLAIDLQTLEVELKQLTLDELAAGVDPALLAEREQAQLRLAELDALLADSRLVAPIAGTVLRVLVDEGTGIGAGETAVIIADLTQLELESLVREADLREMEEGMSATTAFSAQPGESYELILSALPPPYGTAVTLNESAARFALVNTADFADFALGDRMVIDLILAENEETLWLPPAAVRNFSGRDFVVIQDGDTQRRVDVQLGLESRSRVEILEGVAAGETVVGP